MVFQRGMVQKSVAHKNWQQGRAHNSTYLTVVKLFVHIKTEGKPVAKGTKNLLSNIPRYTCFHTWDLITMAIGRSSDCHCIGIQTARHVVSSSTRLITMIGVKAMVKMPIPSASTWWSDLHVKGRGKGDIVTPTAVPPQALPPLQGLWSDQRYDGLLEPVGGVVGPSARCVTTDRIIMRSVASDVGQTDTNGLSVAICRHNRALSEK